MRFLLPLLLAAVPVFGQTAIPYTNCGKAGDTFTVYNATANVWPPKKGAEFDVTINGDLAKDITGGNYHLKASFDFIPLIDKTGALSDLNVTFPIKSGPISVTKGLTFPTSVPSGSYDITVSATDANNEEIACVEIKASLAAPSRNTPHWDPITIIDYLPGLANTPVPYTNCGSATDLVTVNSLSADIWPPQKGAAITLFIDANAKSTINDGNYDAAVSWNGIKIDDEKGTLASLGLTLPIQAGSIIAKKTLTVPSVAPSGAINIKATATDGNNNQLFCVNIDTQI